MKLYFELFVYCDQGEEKDFDSTAINGFFKRKISKELVFESTSNRGKFTAVFVGVRKASDILDKMKNVFKGRQPILTAGKGEICHVYLGVVDDSYVLEIFEWDCF